MHIARASDAAEMAATEDPTSDRSCRFVATAWGPGAPWALAHAHELLGFEDCAAGFRPRHRLLCDLHRRHAGLRVGRSRSVVDCLIPTVLEQKVTSVEARHSYHALVRALGEPAPGPASDRRLRLQLPPHPDHVATLGYADLHRFGIERRRAETVLRVCRRAAALDALAWDSSAPAPGEGSAQLRAALVSVPGLGPWTAAVVAQQALGDPDAVIIGDYHLPHVVAWHLAGRRRGTDDLMLELLEPYRGQRARVVRLLVLGGRPARRAPKRRLRSIAAI